MSLHPAFRAYLDELNPLVEKMTQDGLVATPESARAALAGLNAFALTPVEVEQIFDTHLPASASDGYPVPVRVYVPSPGVASDVILFVHGGGHMAGDLDVYDFSARRTAQATGMVIVSVDYRLAPEHQFPVGLTDVYRVLGQLSNLGESVATTGTVYGVADSGGAANLASISMRAAQGEWVSPIARQVLIYPSLDYTMGGESITELGTGYFLSVDRVKWYFDHYFPYGTDRKAASPLYGSMSTQMPETLVIVAEYDPLRSEALEYVGRMQAAGAKAHALVAPGMLHAFAFFETKVPEDIQRLYEVIGGFLRSGEVPGSW